MEDVKKEEKREEKTEELTGKMTVKEDTEFLESGIRVVKEFAAPEELYETLINMVKSYHPSDNVSLIEKAYRIAADAHKDQYRKSGEPYIIHPLSVAIILADLELDKETIAAGLLHDVVEDTAMTEEDMKREFGDEVALIVSGVTKIGQLSYTTDKLETQAETYRKMFLAMSQDIRVVLVKLADRLHNMRTAKYWSPKKQVEKARETLDIYAPLASRLGISKIKVELDDLSLKYLEPEAYYDLVSKVAMKKNERQTFIDGIIHDVSENLKRAGIHAEIKGRYKHFFSIYRKMVKQNKTLDQVYDMFAIRVITETVPECYAVLGLINSMYMMMPGRFKDYISVQKKNGYQSLHNTMIARDGQPFEVQIRTREMHRIAEYGIAAHWKYKEISQKGGKENADKKQAEWGGKSSAQQEQEKLNWLSEILELQRESDNKEYMNLLKGDLNLFTEEVYCFSPKGRVVSLPAGSTCIDFAYAIHTAVGNKMVGARVNDRLVPLETELKSGDRVEVVTSNNSTGPKYEWLKIAKSSQAKNKINQWFRQQNKAENISKGRDRLAEFAKEKGYNLDSLLTDERKEALIQKYTLRNWEALLAAVGHGGLKEGQVVNKLIDLYEKENKARLSNEEILRSMNERGEAYESKLKHNLQSFQGISIHYGKCCSPVPGDEIVGFTTRGRGLTIHRTDCVNIMAMTQSDRERLFPVDWPEKIGKNDQYEVIIKLYAQDRRGLMADVAGVIADNKINISTVNSGNPDKNGVISMQIGIYVRDKADFQTIQKKLMQVPSVFDIKRTNS